MGPDQGETWSGKGQRRSPSPHIPLKAMVAKQMAHSTFLNRFSTQSLFFFACLLFIPLVKSSTSCHCLKENVRGLWLPVPLLREGARGPQPAVVLATGQVKQLRGWAPHQNKPTKGVHSQPVPHSHSVQVETQILPKALSLLFPCLLPDIPKRSILFPFQRENKEEVWLPGIQAV